MTKLAWLGIACLAVSACGDGKSGQPGNDGRGGNGGAAGSGGGGSAGGGGGSSGSGGDDSGSGGLASDLGGHGGDLATTSTLLQQLIAVTAHCAVASNGRYATDGGLPPTVDICRLNGAFFWKADMDIDCDGQPSPQCNGQTDPDFQPQTSFSQSDGLDLNAAALPYIVIPQSTMERFDHTAAGIEPGAVAVVLFNGKLNYGVFGDEGPNEIIGEASYAMADSLGINPDPLNGGVDGGVTYIVFTGKQAVPQKLEDHQEAVTLGTQLAQALVRSN